MFLVILLNIALHNGYVEFPPEKYGIEIITVATAIASFITWLLGFPSWLQCVVAMTIWGKIYNMQMIRD